MNINIGIECLCLDIVGSFNPPRGEQPVVLYDDIQNKHAMRK